jgi:flavin-binding protein dodecin
MESVSVMAYKKVDVSGSSKEAVARSSAGFKI